MNHSFKLLYIVWEKFPATRVDLTELFSKQLIGAGHSIDWLLQSEARGPSRIETTGERERFFIGSKGPENGKFNKIVNLCRGWINDFRVFFLVRRQDYDFVQVRDKIFSALFGLIAAKSRKLPFFYWLSYPYAENDLYRAKDFGSSMSFWQPWLYRLRGAASAWVLYHLILPRADHIFVQSDRMLEDVATHGIPRSKMTPVPMGVNLSLFEQNQMVAIDDDRLSGRLPIVYVGTLTVIRKMDFMLHVMPKVLQSAPTALLVLVGTAEARDLQHLHDEVARLNLEEDVLFTGNLPMVEAMGYVQCAKVCVSPFRPSPVLDSASPTKIVEYLACNKPVVANDHPDQSKVISESGAGIVVPYDVDAFAKAIVDLLQNEEKATQMAAGGRGYVRAHRSYDAIAKQVEQVYVDFLERG